MVHWGKPSNNRGSPHVYCFLCVANAPVLTSNSKEEYVAFVDEIVHAFLPDRNENPELHYLVTLKGRNFRGNLISRIKKKWIFRENLISRIAKNQIFRGNLFSRFRRNQNFE